MRFLLVIAFVSLSFFGFCQREDLAGTIQDSSSGEGLIGVHVINETLGKLAISSPDGGFQLPARIGDVITISHVGYKKEEFSVTKETPDQITISLIQEIIELDEVQVSILPEYWRFKQLIIETQPMDSSLVVFGLDAIPKEYLEDIPANRQSLYPFPNKIPPGKGIPFSLSGLTAEGKQKKKLERILAKQELARTANLKFNRKWVAEETGLDGDELTSFIAFCNFSLEFIVETPLYDIHKEMMALLDDFHQDQNKSSKGDNRYSPGA